jgi:RNA polymerase sigma-70 factor (ECF subfamily)
MTRIGHGNWGEVIQGDDEADQCPKALNRWWTTALSARGAERERAADELYGYLLQAARSEFARRTDPVRLSGAERDDLAHQAAADALVSIIRRLPDFRGDSMFTTWARSFVAFEARVKVRQHDQRRSKSHALSDEEWGRLQSRCTDGPDAVTEAGELNQAVMTAIATTLTARQRSVFVGIVINGVSIDQVAAQLGSNRNAIYQLLFHARRKLRRHLADSDLLFDPSAFC